MKFIDLVEQRRSIRNFSPESVDRESLRRCMEAARLAPSACNSQPWRFHVVDRDPLRGELARAAFGGVYRMNRFAVGAPALVVVSRIPSLYAARMGGLMRGINFSLIDIGIAVEHFVLQAEEEGLGTCWLGWFNGRGVRRVLGLDRREKPDIMLAAGRPAGERPAARSRRPPEAIYRFMTPE